MTGGGTDRARRHWHAFLTGARRYFLTGLVIILPTFLTFYVLWFLWGLVDAILAPASTGATWCWCAARTTCCGAWPSAVWIAPSQCATASP